ncbi:Conserved_hypothetical protein [Hexamita inflata]|uniref:Uncharacterized protein n=1 Tax=Hexamita inflata TaxID=28002 RepID=A0AA86QBH6_9EUKA|nr:Conserved hypothetical protein [Hexamita inflata]
MQHYVIGSKEDLLNHFGSSKKLEICDLQQMKDLLLMNVSPEVWEDAQNRNLISFSKEFIQQTQEFTFNNGGIEYFYLVSFLTNLKQLYLIDNNIEDISALQHLPQLTHLNLQYNKLTSYTLALPNLVELSLDNNKLQDISGLQHSSKLQSLILSKTETVELFTISQLINLKSLNLSNNNIQNIRPLKFCTQLIYLNISATSVSDIWSLQFTKNLKALYMDNTKVVDLHPLQQLYKLVYICADNTCIIDVSTLSNLTQLKILELSCNKITNVETIEHHPNFAKYHLSDQQVPTTDELKFYNKILSVHSFRKQITKLIQTENKVSKFREQLTHQKEQFKQKINEQILIMNKKIEIYLFSQNSYADQ